MEPKRPRSSDRHSLTSLLYLSSSQLVSNAANAVHVMKMSAAFTRIGVDTTLVAMRGDGSDDHVARYYGYDPGTFSIVRVPAMRSSILARLDSVARNWPRARIGAVVAVSLGLGQLRQLVSRTRPSIVYGRSLWWALTAVPSDIPFAIEIHALPGSATEEIPHRMVLRRKNLSGVVFISEALRERYLARFPELARGNTLVAHDGADPALEGEAKRSKNAKTRIGYFGHLYPGRGIEVLAYIARAIPSVEVRVVGGTAADLSAWRSGDAPANIVFHGHVPHAGVAALQSECDILVAPYQRRVAVSGGAGNTVDYMSPLKVFEYMASGRAIIASDLPALREVLHDQRNALLVAPDDKDQWVAAVRKLMDDPELRARIGQCARADLEAQYTWTARARRIADFLMRDAARPANSVTMAPHPDTL